MSLRELEGLVRVKLTHGWSIEGSGGAGTVGSPRRILRAGHSHVCGARDELDTKTAPAVKGR